MSTLVALFRRLVFRRRATTEKASDDSQNTQKHRTKSLNLPATQNSIREKSRINVQRGSQVVIRNRSQSVTVERKHVSRSIDKQSSPSSRRQSKITVHSVKVPVNSTPSATSLAPTLSTTYHRKRSASTANSRPTVIVIQS
ncbi:unnamed protein product [Caenorhabditis sp. 36 PRJEB53466]|nr:unnamed protein product [Caenorhabditis sp. 36 PRJEB53466]